MRVGRAGAGCELAGPGIDAVAHVLAHVQVPPRASTLVRASSLFDARYVAWCAATLGASAVAPVARDAPLLGALLADAGDGHLLQALLGLHHDPVVLRRAAAFELDAADLPALEQTSLAAVRHLARQHPALVEITRCVVGLVASSYEDAWRDGLRPALETSRREVDDALVDVFDALPSMEGARVYLSHPLGARGRVLPGMLLVGAPSTWSGVEAATTAALIAHEHAVQLAGALVDGDPSLGEPRLDDTARWAAAERLALDAVGLRLRAGAAAEAHRAHVASLDTSAVGSAPLEPDQAVRLEGLLDLLAVRARPDLTPDATRPSGPGSG